ncbi:hypothetical protein HGH92_20050 [Chitinophaga varians]|uniref:Uncharacterized protein n=1 Tax=Chitinophaga varians TaxID=2202339 RepID=A0A847RXC7_9BACT|nr:hypothetical protein [Chitinophaga varians]NLR66614.1 hypothetical protein [Chitinophaga varians]
MTVEALAKLKSVSEITPSLLKELYDKVNLKEINKRLKSYTMVFLNNPLVNPAKKANGAGESTYHHLLNAIMDSFESEGDNVCEISGLRFSKTFENFYEEEIERQKELLIRDIKDEKQLKKEIRNIEKTDTHVNRSWFPLIGGLGSDAQALPQAKFTVHIHPICVPILQFLPLSALLYKRGVLLVDSANFELSRAMVAENARVVAEKIQTIPTKERVENVRNFSRGDYMIKVLEVLNRKEYFEETYSDLNMWSFSNFGNDASCKIDRLPNSFIRKLQRLYKNAKIERELREILSNNEIAFNFLECLEENSDWSLLYPGVFGSGKKKMEYEGVSPEFLEAYYEEIGRSHFVSIAKYIAGLIEKYKSHTFEKILNKKYGWNDPEYRVELFKVFVKATENGEWSMADHITILDNKEELPVKNNYYQLHKLIHFFTQKKIYSNVLWKIDVSKARVYKACTWIIGLIQNDSKINTIKSNLINPNEYTKVGYDRVIFDAIDNFEVEIENVIEVLYDNAFTFKKFGLNELLRIFFSQPQQEVFSVLPWESRLKEDHSFKKWLDRIRRFSDDYRNYYYMKYQKSTEDRAPYNKFIKTVSSIVKENDQFYSLLNEMIYNTNQFIKENERIKSDKWRVEDLLTNPLGNNTWNICVLAIKFLLRQSAVKPLTEKDIVNKNQN